MPFLGNIIGGGPPTDGGGPLESSDNPGEIINSDSADITIVVEANCINIFTDWVSFQRNENNINISC